MFRPRRFRALALAGVLATAASLILPACGTPTKPGPIDQPPPPVTNNPPVIQSIAIQGAARPRQPASFADLNETIEVAATVRDDETAVGQLQYIWTAPVGTFSGTGARVTWQAPAQLTPTPTDVTIRLEVVERYGTGTQAAEHRVSSTATLSLHDSVKEVGDMARQFLLDFSDSNIRDVNFIMRNFGTSCPSQHEVDAERSDVVANRERYRILNSRIGAATVTVNFGGSCPFRFKAGDACAVVPAFWDSVDLSNNTRGTLDGNDIIAASYSSRDARWWLCASDYQPRTTTGSALANFIR